MRRRVPKDVRAKCESCTREEVNVQRRQEFNDLWECLNGSLGPRTYCYHRRNRAVLAGRHESYRSPVAGLIGWVRLDGSCGVDLQVLMVLLEPATADDLRGCRMTSRHRKGKRRAM